MSRAAQILQRLIGAMFLVAGISKFFPYLEDPYVVLIAAQRANADGPLALLSDFALTGAVWIIPLVGAVMIVTGALQLSDRGPVIAACLVQIAMMLMFVAMLRAAFPAIWLIDGVIALGELIVIGRRMGWLR